jgi:hypothetical protein
VRCFIGDHARSRYSAKLHVCLLVEADTASPSILRDAEAVNPPNAG